MIPKLLTRLRRKREIFVIVCGIICRGVMKHTGHWHLDHHLGSKLAVEFPGGHHHFARLEVLGSRPTADWGDGGGFAVVGCSVAVASIRRGGGASVLGVGGAPNPTGHVAAPAAAVVSA